MPSKLFVKVPDVKFSAVACCSGVPQPVVPASAVLGRSNASRTSDLRGSLEKAVEVPRATMRTRLSPSPNSVRRWRPASPLPASTSLSATSRPDSTPG